MGQELTLRRAGRLLLGTFVFGWAWMACKPLPTLAGLAALSLGFAGAVAVFVSVITIQGALAFKTVESLEVMNALSYGGRAVSSYPHDRLPRFRPPPLPARRASGMHHLRPRMHPPPPPPIPRLALVDRGGDPSRGPSLHPPLQGSPGDWAWRATKAPEVEYPHRSVSTGQVHASPDRPGPPSHARHTNPADSISCGGSRGALGETAVARETPSGSTIQPNGLCPPVKRACR